MFSPKSVSSRLKFSMSVLIALNIITIPVYAANLAIVIDDVGYSTKRDQQVLSFPVTVAIIPTAPNAKMRGEEAQAANREVILHLPMLPFNGKNLEPDTLTPEMSQQEINRIIKKSLEVVPMAVGINNHMGSEMTSDLPAMRRVFKALEDSNLFFLDSLTTGKSQAKTAAEEFNRTILKRDVFLDDTISESEIEHQFDEALRVARKNGYAIAIGHPHQATINVLNRRLADLPSDIHLVRLAQLQDINHSTFDKMLAPQHTKTDVEVETEELKSETPLSVDESNNLSKNSIEPESMSASKMIGIAPFEVTNEQKNEQEKPIQEEAQSETSENSENTENKAIHSPIDFSKLKVALPAFVKKIIFTSPNTPQSEKLIDASETNIHAPTSTEIPTKRDQDTITEQ